MEVKEEVVKIKKALEVKEEVVGGLERDCRSLIY